MAPAHLVYYCSGHGYGHATRVSAFSCHLLGLDGERPIVHIVSSAPAHVFADSIAQGAQYRYAEIDPVIVQPLAYHVDRRKSVTVLEQFLEKKEQLLEIERTWLQEIRACCVLSDAAFLGCLAARAAGLPSILITNFTFDSVYSYLSTSILNAPVSPYLDHLSPTQHRFEDLLPPDTPIPVEELAPLVEEIHAGYRCADLLLLLPGYIPIPSFSVKPALPSFEWVNSSTNALHPDVARFLLNDTSSYTLLPSLPPITNDSSSTNRLARSRKVIPAPLLVRQPSQQPSVYTPAGRTKFLSSIGVPERLHDPEQTKVLIVSFGGQVFRKPSRSGSRSRTQSRDFDLMPPSTPASEGQLHGTHRTSHHGLGIEGALHSLTSIEERKAIEGLSKLQLPDPPPAQAVPPLMGSSSSASTSASSLVPITPTRLATPSHIWVPGAPPAARRGPTSPILNRSFSPMISPITSPVTSPVISTIPPTPNPKKESTYFDMTAIAADDDANGYFDEEDMARLLPDESWIAIVCGVSKAQWNENADDNELPEGFYVAPRDVYMPDLTAAADVLLGKLGYGTTSECVDSCTPFVYVSRPLFIEEHGLRLLLERDGVGVELSRSAYEAGDWAGAVEDAWLKGRDIKAKKRKDAAAGIGMNRRAEEGREMARTVVDWVTEWHGQGYGQHA